MPHLYLSLVDTNISPSSMNTMDFVISRGNGTYMSKDNYTFVDNPVKELYDKIIESGNKIYDVINGNVFYDEEHDMLYFNMPDRHPQLIFEQDGPDMKWWKVLYRREEKQQRSILPALLFVTSILWLISR